MVHIQQLYSTLLGGCRIAWPRTLPYPLVTRRSFRPPCPILGYHPEGICQISTSRCPSFNITRRYHSDSFDRIFWCRSGDSNPHGFPVKPLPNHFSLLFPLAALIDGSRQRILVHVDASGIQLSGRVLFAPPQNRLKAWSYVFADVVQWVPKSASNAFPVVEIFHIRSPDSRWHLVPMPDSFTFIVPLPMSSTLRQRVGRERRRMR